MLILQELMLLRSEEEGGQNLLCSFYRSRKGFGLPGGSMLRLWTIKEPTPIPIANQEATWADCYFTIYQLLPRFVRPNFVWP